MQYKYGFIEEARTSFEIMLKHHPKRSDIWNVYIDKEIKIVKNPEKIRHIFEKCLTVDFKIKAYQKSKVFSSPVLARLISTNVAF